MNHFIEVAGGEIIGPNGRSVVKVSVENITAETAMRVVEVLIDALEKEFYPSDDQPN